MPCIQYSQIMRWDKTQEQAMATYGNVTIRKHKNTWKYFGGGLEFHYYILISSSPLLTSKVPTTNRKSKKNWKTYKLPESVSGVTNLFVLWAPSSKTHGGKVL